MKLTVLGCAGTFPTAESGCSSYVLEQDGFRLLIDCGWGAVSALQRHGWLYDLDAVLVSHLHADHCLDLAAFAYARNYHPTLSLPPLPVFGPQGTDGRIASALESRRPEWLDRVYDWHVYEGGPFEIGPYALHGRQTAHPIECYALRVSADGRTFAYSADSGPCQALIDTANGADLFACEASFVETVVNPPDVHMTGRQAGAVAVSAGAGTLLLTHLVAWNDEAQVLDEAAQSYDGALRIARPGAAYVL